MRKKHTMGRCSVTIYDWMWTDGESGLGLGHGADLIVYAALFGLTDGGAGVYDRPCSVLARMLGYSRETVQRSLTRLMALDVVWSPSGRASSSGTPRTYAICPGPIERVWGSAPGITQRRAAADAANGTGSHMRSGDSFGCDAGESPEVPTCDDTATVNGAYVEEGIVGVPTCDGGIQLVIPGCGEMSRPQGGTCDACPAACDGTGRTTCDETPQPTPRHTQENQDLPAKTSSFDSALVSSLHSLPEMPDRGVEPCQAQGGRRPLTPAEHAAFETLVSRSLLPVDDAFLERNLAAFESIVASGVPADAIVEAYDDYAAYQHDRRRRSGVWHPMHLLHWLEMNPNGNVSYVMRRREIEGMRAAASMGRSVGGDGGSEAPRRRRGPRLTLCRDRGRAIWFVDDDHGSRRVLGAEGIEDLTEAMRAYERMYERECHEAARAA